MKKKTTKKPKKTEKIIVREIEIEAEEERKSEEARLKRIK